MLIDDKTAMPVKSVTPDEEAVAQVRALLNAELDAAMDDNARAGLDAAGLAVWMAERIRPEEAEANLKSPMALARLAAAADFLETTGQVTDAPSLALSTALRTRLKEAKVIAWRRPPPNPAPANSDTFLLLAAASEADDPTIVCRSQSGLWTLEVFTGQSPDDRMAGRGSLLLSVHADHAVGYEGRRARIFVMIEGAERTLAEDFVRGGELFAPVSLLGLDLRRRDAVNVVFDSAAQAL